MNNERVARELVKLAKSLSGYDDIAYEQWAKEVNEAVYDLKQGMSAFDKALKISDVEKQKREMAGVLGELAYAVREAKKVWGVR